MLPPSLQDSLPAGWLAFAGRASTLWIAAKGFRSSILLFWTWPGAREVSFEPPSRLTSFDHLVGARKHGRRNFEPERLGGLEVDHQFVLGRRLHRKISRLRALEDTVDIAGGASDLRNDIRAVGDQAAAVSEIRVGVHSRQSVAGGERDDEIAMNRP